MANQIRIDGDYAHLSLTLGQETVIDLTDLSLVTQLQWHAAINKMGGFYVSAWSSGKTIYLHRFLMGVGDPKIQVDHKNHDTLDNRRSTGNLRVATNQQNNENRKGVSKTRSSTGVRGVAVNHVDGKSYYKARVQRDNRIVSSRNFPYSEEGLQQAAFWVSEERKQVLPFTTEKDVTPVELPAAKRMRYISDETIAEVRRRARNGELYKAIALDLNLSRSYVSEVVRGLVRPVEGEKYLEKIPLGSHPQSNKGHGSL